MNVFKEADFHAPIWSNGFGYFQNDKSILEEDYIKVISVSDAQIVPSDRGYIAVDSDGRIVSDSLLQRCGIGKEKEFIFPKKIFDDPNEALIDIGDKPIKISSTHQIPTGIFLGNSHREFGHCITECLSRLWALPELPSDMPIFMSGIESNNILQTISELLSIPRNRFISVSGRDVLRVKNLLIPMQAIHLFGKYSRKISATWEKISQSADARSKLSFPDKVFLNRSSLRRNVEEQERICTFYENHGFSAINPEAMPFLEQIIMCRRATHIAGCVGSQMHLAQFQIEGRFTVFGHTNFLPADFACSAFIKDQHSTFYVADGNNIKYKDILESPFGFSINFLNEYLPQSIK
ncbi:DUF563 domain-containing protein [Roseomonas sp. 18066]|uniref:glycosyltransferase family 61 protein n=1 Tax=Roseomonas sp. 18066 TaxID=2681412 RepID=UPI00135C1C31|nr:glycosyltransferase 61 family protein [Roseomonas sp. 18066]